MANTWDDEIRRDRRIMDRCAALVESRTTYRHEVPQLFRRAAARHLKRLRKAGRRHDDPACLRYEDLADPALGFWR